VCQKCGFTYSNGIVTTSSIHACKEGGGVHERGNTGKELGLSKQKQMNSCFSVKQTARGLKGRTEAAVATEISFYLRV
jgi:hypothetical protein